MYFKLNINLSPFCGQLTFVRKILALFMYGAGFSKDGSATVITLK